MYKASNICICIAYVLHCIAALVSCGASVAPGASQDSTRATYPASQPAARILTDIARKLQVVHLVALVV